MRSRSQEAPELLRTQARVPGDPGHRDRVDRVMTGNDQFLRPVRHDDVLALTQNPISDPLQGTDRVEVIDAGESRHVQTATSTSLISARSAGSISASIYSRIASAMFASASSTSTPCDQQPGRLGTQTATPASDR